jgi:RNA polymerase sigma factor (sigma-70 family)
VTEEEIAHIVSGNKGLICRVLRSFKDVISYEDMEDMEQEVRIAMLQALRKYDESRGVPAIAFMTQCMYHFVSDRKTDYYRQHHIRRRGSEDTIEVSVSSLDAVTADGTVYVEEHLADDHAEHPWEEAIVAQITSEEALVDLPARTADILRLQAFDYTLQEIGNFYGGLSRERVRQIADRGREIVKKRVKAAS